MASLAVIVPVEPAPPLPPASCGPARLARCADKEHFDEAQEHYQRIASELAAIKNSPPRQPVWACEWAGTYRAPNSIRPWRHMIHLAPQSGFYYGWYTCGQGPFAFNYGPIAESFDDGVRVSPQLPIDNERSLAADRFYFVRWGERHYLIPENRMLRLVNDYNWFGPRAADIMNLPLRELEWSLPACAAPELPERWDRLLMDAPFITEITGIVGLKELRSDYEVRVSLRAGAACGVFMGMELRTGDSESLTTLTVIQVDDDRSEAEGLVWKPTQGHARLPATGDLAYTRLNDASPTPGDPSMPDISIYNTLATPAKFVPETPTPFWVE